MRNNLCIALKTMNTAQKKCYATVSALCIIIILTLMCPCGENPNKLSQSSIDSDPALISGIETQLHVPRDPVAMTTEAKHCQDADCTRFQKMLNQWPPGKPKAAIYFLVQARRMHHLEHSLRNLDKYFNNNFKYPVILFHEREFNKKKPLIGKITSRNVFYQEVHFTIPDFLPREVSEDIPCMSPISYRHMCRFQAKGVYEEPIMQGLDYYWRLDDDSFILQPITYDVFRFMRNKGKRYGYIWRHVDSDTCTEGLWEAAREHIAKHDIRPQFFDKWDEPSLYYNNFEIAETKLWFSPDYKQFIDYLDRLGGIYYHRWGDAPIKGIAVSIFIAENDTHRFSDIAYRHNSFENKLKEIMVDEND